MNYGELKSQFQGLLNRRDITASQVTTFLDQGISRAQRKLRIPAMEKSVLVTIESYDGIIIPNDLIELRGITDVTTGRTLTRARLDTALALEMHPGCPAVYARQGGKWRIGPSPEAGRVLRLDYWAEEPALSADADTNLFSEIAPDLLIYSALSYACDFFLDDRAATFEARYMAIVKELQDQADRDELTGNSVMAPAYCYPED